MNLEELREKIANMPLEEVTARLAEIDKEVRSISEAETTEDGAVEKVENLTTETEELQARQKDLEDLAERKKKVKDVVKGNIMTRTIETGGKETMAENYTANSPEYRTAWLKKMAINHRGEMMFGDLTEVEQRAFTFTTENSGNVVPTELQNRIIDRIKHEAPIFEDAAKSAITKGFAIPVRTAIAAGDAAVVAEGAANADEQDTFTQIELSGVEIAKTATLTRKMQFQSIDSFENWLVGDISKRILVAKENVLMKRLDGSAPATGIAAVSAVAIADANVLTNQVYDDATIRAIMAKIDEAGQVVVYANRATIFNGLAGIEDGQGAKAFITSPQADPTVAGVLYGAVVKPDPNLADNVAYFIVRGAVKANAYAPLEIFPTKEAKTANTIYTGTEIFDGGLENPLAAVKVTFDGE